MVVKMPLSILKDLVRRLIPFLVILGLLLIYTAYFNMHYQWYGISLVTRAYVFMLAFYIIFNYASIDIEERREAYISAFGKTGDWRLFFHSRVLPFIVIFLMTVLYAFTEYTDSKNWLMNSVLALLDGEFANIIYYSLLLLLVLKLKKNPGITVPLFVILSVSFYFIDQLAYESVQGGAGILVLKLLKVIILIYFLLFEYFSDSISYTIKGFIAVIVSGLMVSFSAGVLHLVYVQASRGHQAKIQAGFMLMKYGFAYPMSYLQQKILNDPDYKEFARLLEYAEYADTDFTYSPEEWKSLLFAQNVHMADLVSRYLLHEHVILSYTQLVRYATEKSESPDEKLEAATNFVKLTSRYCDGNEQDLMNRIKRGNEHFTLWGLAVIAQHRKIVYVPFLIDYLTHIESIYENAAYGALVAITGKDPAGEFNRQVNDPGTILFFRDYYLQNRNSDI
ncbi:MAG: hypothetical protein ACOCX9_00300 [Spirochaetota bacterium]